MKKKHISLVLALLLLAGCNSEPKEADNQEEVNQAVEELEKTTSEETKSVEEQPIDEPTVENEQAKEKPEQYNQNERSLGEMINTNPDLDISSIPDRIFLNAYYMPKDLYELYLSTNMRQYKVPEEELVGTMKANMGQDAIFCGETGIWPNSIPIINAINEASYKVLDDIMQRGNNPKTYMAIPERNGIMNDYTAFLDPNEAENYWNILSTYDLPNYLAVCYSTQADNPLGRWFLRYTGTFEYKVFEKDYPSGISLTTYLSYSDSNYPCYITYIGTIGEELEIRGGFYGIWAMPIDLSILQKSTQNTYNTLPVFHMITGKGFINIR